MNPVLFCFWKNWVIMAILKFYAILLKYPIFEGVFFIFSGASKYKNGVSVLLRSALKS